MKRIFMGRKDEAKITIPISDFIDTALGIRLLTNNRDALDLFLGLWPKKEIWDIKGIPPYLTSQDFRNFWVERPLVHESVRESMEDAMQELKEILQENGMWREE